jgi:hypothetical protein
VRDPTVVPVRVVCPECDGSYVISLAHWEKHRGTLMCGDCYPKMVPPLAGPPSLRLVA